MSSENRRLLRLPEVRQISGLSKSSIYRMIDRGQFPAQVNIGTRAVAWRETDLQKWLEDRPERVCDKSPLPVGEG